MVPQNHEYREVFAFNPDGTLFKQTVERPSVSWSRALPQVLIPVAAAIAFCIVAERSGLYHLSWIAWVALLLYALLRLKRILLFMISVYQRYAPLSLRSACCFEPTCSEYMRLAIEKYGVRTGFSKGIDRLLRCKPPNGGYDWP